mgnify:CR=1 FL=1
MAETVVVLLIVPVCYFLIPRMAFAVLLGFFTALEGIDMLVRRFKSP